MSGRRSRYADGHGGEFAAGGTVQQSPPTAVGSTSRRPVACRRSTSSRARRCGPSRPGRFRAMSRGWTSPVTAARLAATPRSSISAAAAESHAAATAERQARSRSCSRDRRSGYRSPTLGAGARRSARATPLDRCWSGTACRAVDRPQTYSRRFGGSWTAAVPVATSSGHRGSVRWPWGTLGPGRSPGWTAAIWRVPTVIAGCGSRRPTAVQHAPTVRSAPRLRCGHPARRFGGRSRRRLDRTLTRRSVDACRHRLRRGSEPRDRRQGRCVAEPRASGARRGRRPYHDVLGAPQRAGPSDVGRDRSGTLCSSRPTGRVLPELTVGEADHRR